MKGRECVSGMAPMNAEVKTIFMDSASLGARSAKVVEEIYECALSENRSVMPLVPLVLLVVVVRVLYALCVVCVVCVVHVVCMHLDKVCRALC